MKTTTAAHTTRDVRLADGPFSQALKRACGDAWSEATRHRFVKELASDTLSDDVFRRYLVQDHVFLDALTRLVARGVAATSVADSRRRLAGFLGVLTSEENDYFERSFDALGVGADERGQAQVSVVTYAFEDLFRAAVEEYDYAAVITALLPVEWVYHEWASWAKKEGAGSQRFWVQEWVDIHSTPEFGEFVDWLRREVDAHGARSDPAARERLAARFVRAVELEGAFFSDAYEAMA